MAARQGVRRKRAEEMAQVVLEATKTKKAPVPIEEIAESYGVAVRYEPVESTYHPCGSRAYVERAADNSPSRGSSTEMPAPSAAMTIST